MTDTFTFEGSLFVFVEDSVRFVNGDFWRHLSGPLMLEMLI